MPALVSDLEIERAVLCGMVIHQFRDPIISEDLFSIPEHAEVLRAMTELDSEAQPSNLIHIGHYLRDRSSVGHTILATLPMEEPTCRRDWQGCLARLLDLAGRRMTYRLHNRTGTELGEAITPAERQAIADSYRVRIEEINNRTDQSSLAPSIRERLPEMLTDLQIRMKGEDKSNLISTGIPRLDALLGGGFEPGRLIVIGARPGRGKSALGMDLIYHAVTRENKRAIFYSLEMTADQVMRRFLTLGSGVPVQKISRPKENELSMMDLQKLSTVSEQWAAKGDKLQLDCRANLTASEICSSVKRNLLRPEIVLVDYLQIVQPDKRRDNRLAEVTDISQSFLNLKKEANVPVIVCAQLNRESANGARRPRPSDLRESGAIEQDADIILLIHWIDEEAQGDKADVEIIVAKNRDGAEGIVKCTYQKSQLKFAADDDGY